MNNQILPFYSDFSLAPVASHLEARVLDTPQRQLPRLHRRQDQDCLLLDYPALCICTFTCVRITLLLRLYAVLMLLQHAVRTSTPIESFPARPQHSHDSVRGLFGVLVAWTLLILHARHRASCNDYTSNGNVDDSEFGARDRAVPKAAPALGIVGYVYDQVFKKPKAQREKVSQAHAALARCPAFIAVLVQFSLTGCCSGRLYAAQRLGAGGHRRERHRHPSGSLVKDGFIRLLGRRSEQLCGGLVLAGLGGAASM